MVVEVRVNPASGHERFHESLVSAVDHLEQAINAAPESLQAELVEAGARLISGMLPEHASTRALATGTGSRAVGLLATDAVSSSPDVVREEFALLQRSFAYRRRILEEALSNAEAAHLLGTSRQTPHDRVARGTLLAIKDFSGSNRYPIWQFDPEGAGGVVDGLPEVLAALAVTPLEKVGWLTKEHPALDDLRPIDALRQGRRDAVLKLASAVGVN